MSKKTIVVCDHIHEAGLKILEKTEDINYVFAADVDKVKLLDIIKDADVAITRSSTDVDEKFLNAAVNLKAIIRAGVGYDNVDIEGCSKRGIIAMNVPTANTIAAVELTMAHMLSCMRKFPYAHNQLKIDRVWKREDWYGNELYGKKLGVIGFGNIGHRVALRAKAFEMDVITYDPYIPSTKATDLGITYTEFSYMIMQAMDFYWLHENKNCQLQVAGQDQWGNITAGIELIRKKTGKEAYGFTMPLLTKSDGTKFGKTNGKAIWLDREKTSPYEMYQFFINSEDDKVIDYLKFLTFLTPEEIMELEEKNKTQPHLREAHKALAREVITFLHGEGAYEEAVQVSQTLFSGQIQNLTLEQVDVAFEGVPTVETEENEMNILDALILVGAAKSKREAREFVNGGSVLINGERIKDLEFTVKKEDAFGQSKTVIRRGKKNYFVLKYNG